MAAQQINLLVNRQKGLKHIDNASTCLLTKPAREGTAQPCRHPEGKKVSMSYVVYQQ